MPFNILSGAIRRYTGYSEAMKKPLFGSWINSLYIVILTLRLSFVIQTEGGRRSAKVQANKRIMMSSLKRRCKYLTTLSIMLRIAAIKKCAMFKTVHSNELAKSRRVGIGNKSAQQKNNDGTSMYYLNRGVNNQTQQTQPLGSFFLKPKYCFPVLIKHDMSMASLRITGNRLIPQYP